MKEQCFFLIVEARSAVELCTYLEDFDVAIENFETVQRRCNSGFARYIPFSAAGVAKFHLFL